MKNYNTRLSTVNPDAYFEDDIKRLHALSITHKFSDEYIALFSYSNCIIVSFTEKQWKGSQASIGAQLLIEAKELKSKERFAIGEIVRIDDNQENEKCIYLHLLKTDTLFPQWKGYIKILSIELQLIHYNTEVYRKILEYLRNNQLKKTLANSVGRACFFPSLRALVTINRGLLSATVNSFIYNRNMHDEMKHILRDAYFERQTFIICTASTDRLFDLAVFCSEDEEMSKQTVLFPPGPFCGNQWKSKLLNNIKILKVDYDMSDDDWDILKIEHELKFRSREAIAILKETHPRIIMGTAASLLLVMDGIKAFYAEYKDRLPKRFFFDEGELIPDVYALLLLSSLSSVVNVTIIHASEENPVKFGLNMTSLATMALPYLKNYKK